MKPGSLRRKLVDNLWLSGSGLSLLCALACHMAVVVTPGSIFERYFYRPLLVGRSIVIRADVPPQRCLFKVSAHMGHADQLAVALNGKRLHANAYPGVARDGDRVRSYFEVAPTTLGDERMEFRVSFERAVPHALNVSLRNYRKRLFPGIYIAYQGVLRNRTWVGQLTSIALCVLTCGLLWLGLPMWVHRWFRATASELRWAVGRSVVLWLGAVVVCGFSSAVSQYQVVLSTGVVVGGMSVAVLLSLRTFAGPAVSLKWRRDGGRAVSTRGQNVARPKQNERVYSIVSVFFWSAAASLGSAAIGWNGTARLLANVSCVMLVIVGGRRVWGELARQVTPKEHLGSRSAANSAPLGESECNDN